MRSLRYLFPFIIILLFPVIELEAQNIGRLEGTVTNQSGAGMAHVNVSISGTDLGAATDNAGHFSITSIPIGQHRIVVSAIGYQTGFKTVSVRAGATTSVDFILKVSTTQLSQILVKGEALRKENQSITINTIETERIQKLHTTKTDELLNHIPGVQLGAYGQGGTADVFSIRGFGSGGHGGDVAVQIDGVSLNESAGHADGYADMNVVIPLNIKAIDIYKGPSSVLFGRFAKGGAIAFETRKGGAYTDFMLSGGSYNTVDFQTAIGKPLSLSNGKQLKTNFAAQLFNTKGYTENAEILKGNFSGRLAYDLSEKTDIAVSLRGHSSNWHAPGYITKEQFLDKEARRKQGPNAEDDGGDKLFASERIDVNHTFNENLRLLVFGYAVQQEFTRFNKFGTAPQNEDHNDRKVFAFGASLNGKNKIGEVEVNWIGGIEYYNEESIKRSWETENRVRQTPLDHNVFDFQTVSLYGQGIFEISPYFKPSVGLRFDTYSGDLKQKDPANGALLHTYDLNKLSHFSPKFGITSNLFTGFNLRISATNGFSLPSNTLRYDPDINLDPTQLWQYEIGANYKYKHLFTVDAAAWMLNTINEIVNKPGTNEYYNAGKTQRQGVEVGATFMGIPRFTLRASFAYTTTEIKENQIDNTLEGKELTGIPQTLSTIAADYHLKNGLGLRISIRDVGEYATNPKNTNYYEGYTLTNLEFYYQFGGRYINKGRLFVRVNNVFNEIYSTNTFSFGGPSYYVPAPMRNLRLGIRYSF